MDSDNMPSWNFVEMEKARLSVFEFRVCAHIALRGGSGSGCRRAINDIAKACRMNRNTVRTAIASLCERGIVSRSERCGDTSVLKVKWADVPKLNAVSTQRDASPGALLDSREVEVPQEGMTKRTFRAMPVTRATLLQLPLLVSLSVVSEITGLSFRDIAEEVRTGRLRTYKCRAGGQNKYFRSDIFALAGLSIYADDLRPAQNGPNGSNPCPAPSTNGSRGLTPPPA